MTELLEEAVTALHKLPAAEQDAMAQLILDELADEHQWEQQFAQSHDALTRLAEKVRSDIRRGKVQPIGMDEL